MNSTQRREAYDRQDEVIHGYSLKARRNYRGYYTAKQMRRINKKNRVAAKRLSLNLNAPF